MQSSISMQPIGSIRSPFQDPVGMPIQPAGAAGISGRIELLPEYEPGLLDIEGFSHLILIYALHRMHGEDLQVVPFMDTRPHGVFATRAPRRPNRMGLSVVQLKRVRGCVLDIEDVDILDGTPLLDIKPYVPAFDQPRTAVQVGWYDAAHRPVDEHRADWRFQR